MDSRKLLFKDIGFLALGEVACSALVVLIYALLDRFSLNVILSSLTGCLIILVNHFLLAVFVSQAADRAQSGDVKKAKSMVSLSSVIRLVVMGVALVVAIKLGAKPIPLVLPLLLFRPILMVVEFFGKKVS